MKDYIQKLLREALNELHLTPKLKTVSYPARIEDAWIGKGIPPKREFPDNKIPLTDEMQTEIKNRLSNLEKIIFNVPNTGLALLLYTSKFGICYDDFPKNPLDWGTDLYVLIRDGDKANTLYWKPRNLKPQAELYLKYDDLINYIQGKDVGTISKPITYNILLNIINNLRKK